ncbi:protein kinase domain-containing protein [Chondromyces crocatus]|uniref:Protein kinase n=1 Tax=Chondromyces crocatus TaxID=52 RepID=A0A0K1EMN7_CHOCO|nr:serine/threonine-protein kinase [Chondromyces crocatus]AKT42170.1 protein kinase [Chondromyces crocatus]
MPLHVALTDSRHDEETLSDRGVRDPGVVGFTGGGACGAERSGRQIKVESETLSSRDLPPSVRPPSQEAQDCPPESGGRLAAVSSRRSTELAVAGWDRYAVLGLVGEGGMGAVYKARDPRLNRLVALKFLRSSDSGLVEHFFREARAQAQIDHPNVCKVYEVGEVAGLPYIAMQLIQGGPLGEAMQSMSLEQRVKAIRDVAEGLHEGHRTGLIHRDVKSANILVERTATGEFVPYLVDFGLAREIKAEDRTIFSVEGTPCYMSPEQVAGDLRQLDRRTDVYGLGATLYEALVGEPPFAGFPPLDVIWKVRTELPRPVREIDHCVPMDLETIALKCLEKEPHRRYDSARALAEDLQRYLDDEPVRARRASWVYVGWSKVRKHRLSLGVGALALVALGMVGGVALRARVTAREQRQRAEEVGALAQEIGQDAKEMELFMRYAYALPLHDTMREKAMIRARLSDLERRVTASGERLGPLADGAGHYALGRGFLALGEVEEAVRHLEQSLSRGYDTAEVSFAAGRARAMLYSRALDKASRLPNREAQEARRDEIAREHLEPALRYLRSSVEGARASMPYASALLALLEGRLDDAYAEGERAFGAEPWSYEARVIQGDALRGRATLSEDRGEHELALGDLRRAIALYREASAMATSDPALYDAQAEAWLGVMRIERHRGADLRAAYEQVIQSCDQSLVAEPRRAVAGANKAWAHIHQGWSLYRQGEDPRESLREALAEAEQAMQWGGPDPLAYNSIGAASWLRAQYEAGIGLDTEEPLRRAVESNRRAIEMDPNYGWAHNDIGIALGLLGERAVARGVDPRRFFSESAEHLDRAVALSPGDPTPRANQAWFHAQRALYELEHGVDPAPSVEHAIAHAESALKMRPGHVASHNNLGLAYMLLAEHLVVVGGDARSSLEKALGSFAVALRSSPADVEALRGSGAAWALLSRVLVARGEDPEAALRAGREALTAALAVAPADGEARLSLAALDRALGWAAVSSGRNPRRAFQAAHEALMRAHTQNPRSARPLAALAALHRDRAMMARRGGRAEEDIGEGLRRIRGALSLNPTLPAYRALQGALLVLKARGSRDAGVRGGLLQRAHDDLTQALAGNRFLSREYGAVLAEIEAMRPVMGAGGAGRGAGGAARRGAEAAVQAGATGGRKR